MVIGITGASGAGKHTAALHLQKKGWVILDADAIAHYLYRPYTNVWKAVTETFGEKILNQDDSINRAKLGQIVFDPLHPKEADEALAKLDAIVHPYVRRRLGEEARFQSKKGAKVAVVAALWQELGLMDICEKILWVETQPEIAIRRVCARDNISSEMARMRLRGQQPPSKSVQIVENNGSIEDFHAQLDKILEN